MSQPVAKSIRVLLVVEHALVRAALRMLLESHGSVSVIGEAGDCVAAVDAATRELPDIALLETELGCKSGLDLVPELLAASKLTRVIILNRITMLTHREREVVVRIGEGLKNKQIAERLFVSETTIQHHLSSIFGKLGVSDRLELVIYAYRQGLVKLLSETEGQYRER